jgi:outer membrane protein assembly factor BamB
MSARRPAPLNAGTAAEPGRWKALRPLADRVSGALAVATLALATAAASGQQDNPVYVDDSPRARQLLLQARDHARDNLGEAVRIYQELLDDYGPRLLPSARDPDLFVPVRATVLADLAGDPRLLERYRAAAAAEAQRLLEAGALHDLARSRSLSGPGLEALLRLAQDDLESGSFHAALGRLGEAARHPDLDARRAGHCWYMAGAAATYLGDPARVEQARAALADMGAEGRPLLDKLQALAALRPPAVDRGVSTLDPAPAAELLDLVAQPIWTLPLPDTPLGQRLGDVPGAELSGPRRLRESGSLLTAAPTVAGSRIYVSEGSTVHGLERFTGRPLWPAYVERPPSSAVDQNSRQVADLNVVAAQGGTLVTITGHAYADAVRSDRTIVCLEAETGRPRWESRVDQLSDVEELDGLFPHGAAVIGEGVVYALARKVSPEMLTSCYLVTLHLGDGRLRWARHLASSGAIRSRFARPFSTPLYQDGDVAVATAIGAVARVDGSTGEIKWLRRYSPPLSPYLAERQPWEIEAPVMTPRGLLAIRPDLRRVVLISWADGAEVESTPSTARDTWNSPHYLLAAESMVYGVGADVRAFRAEALDAPAWMFPKRVGPEGAATEPADAEVRGRVEIVGGGLLVPTTSGLYYLDGQTGEVLHHVELEAACNPLAAGPQLIATTSDSLNAYMPPDRAEQMLRQQIAAGPEDPSPALALMRLGLRVRNLAMALEAADLALAAINAAPPDRPASGAAQELFEILLELDGNRLARTAAEGEALFAMIGVVARDPQQRVEHLLAYGAWLAPQALGRAVEAYQSILSTPGLPQAPRELDGLVRPAAAWAADRLAALIEEHGPGIYTPQADFCARRLERLGQRAEPAAILALAEEFPFAPASLDAARQAVLRLAASGDHRGALGAAAQAWFAAPVPARGGALLGLAAWVCEQAGWTAEGEAVLTYAVANLGPDALLRGVAEERAAGAWLEALRSGTWRAPRLGDPSGVATRRGGTLVAAWPGVPLPPGGALVSDPPALAFLDAADLSPKWSTVLPIPGELSILRFDASALLLWVVPHGGEPRVVALDPASGALRWTSPQLPAEPAAGDAGAAGGADLRETIPAAGRDVIALVRRGGGVTALDPSSGTAVLWTARPLAAVQAARLTAPALALAGLREGLDGPAVVVLLDPRSGRVLREIDTGTRGPMRWMIPAALGVLVYGTDAGVEAVESLSGRRLWALRGPETAATPRAWATPGQVMIAGADARPAENATVLRSVRLGDGRLSPPFDLPERGEWDRMDLKDLVVAGERIYAQFGQRIVRLSATGKVMGADVISDQPREYKWLLPAADRLVLVNRFRSEQVPVAGEAGRQTQHTYRVYSLSEDCRLLGEGHELTPIVERLERAAAVDGWLLLATGTQTVALPMQGP